MCLQFISTAGPRQRSHSQVRLPRDSWPHFTVPDSRLPQPVGPVPRIYIPQEQCGPVTPPGTGFPFITFYDSQDYSGDIRAPSTRYSPSVQNTFYRLLYEKQPYRRENTVTSLDCTHIRNLQNNGFYMYQAFIISDFWKGIWCDVTPWLGTNNENCMSALPLSEQINWNPASALTGKEVCVMWWRLVSRPPATSTDHNFAIIRLSGPT
jgi:hypothetical protein